MTNDPSSKDDPVIKRANSLPAISDHPNPWEMLHADTRTFVTLATAFLGLTVTFAQDLTQDSGRLWTGAGWILLTGSIFSAFVASGKIQGQVRTNSTDYGARDVNGWANAVFFLLLGGAVLVAVGAGSGFWSPSDAGVDDIVGTALDAVVEVKDLDADSLEVEVFEQVPGVEANVVISHDSGDRFVVSLALDPLSVIRVGGGH